MSGETSGDHDEEDHLTSDMFGSRGRAQPQEETERLPASGADVRDHETTAYQRTDSATPAVPRQDGDRTWRQGTDIDALIVPGQTLFGKYLVAKLLGQGGMGSVWLVEHKNLGVERALKLILPTYAADPIFRTRLFREARAMVKIAHPNAVAVYDADVADGVAFIEMEFVQGVCLADLLKTGVPMPLDWTARVLDQLCDVLQCAHERKIVHRDLKPSNLMLLDDTSVGLERLKVLDFGIAKTLDSGDQETLTHADQPIGTVAYAGPEQLLGAKVDARSDLYSVGVILYELLTGYRPFTGGTGMVINCHLNTPPPPFAGRNPSVALPEAVEGLVLRCLAKSPQDRPQSARELAESFRMAVGEVATGERTVMRLPKTPPPPPRPRVVVPGRPWRRAALVLVSTMTCVGLIVGGWVYFANKDGDPDSDPGELARDKTIDKVDPSKTIAKVEPEKSNATPVSSASLPLGFRADGEADRTGGFPPVLVSAKDGSRLVLLKGGSFSMGRIPGVETNVEDDDQPAHEVVVPRFYMQETEVTHGQMLRYFAEFDPQGKSDDHAEWRKSLDALIGVGVKEEEARRHPASSVSHRLATHYAEWIGGRLPTEAEWEYAARSQGLDRPYVWRGTSRPDKTLANIDTEGTLVAPDGQGAILTMPVKSYDKDRTDQDVYDLTGNVREWCRDLWAAYGQEAPTPKAGRRPLYPVRGGAFDTPSFAFRTTSHFGREPDDQVALDLGFRCVVECP